MSNYYRVESINGVSPKEEVLDFLNLNRRNNEYANSNYRREWLYRPGTRPGTPKGWPPGNRPPTIRRGVQALENAGAEAWQGDVNDLETLRKAIEQSEGVIHIAFNHDFSRFMASCEEDRKVITAMGEALAGSNCPMVVTSSIGSSNTVPVT